AQRPGVQQAVAPEKHLEFSLSNNMRVKIVHRPGKEAGGIAAAAPRAMLGGEDENLVHADMKGIRFEGVRDLIDERKNDSVHFGVLRAPASTVNAFVIRKLSGRFIELRIMPEQFPGGLAPGLVTEAIDLRNQPDPERVRNADQLPGAGAGDIAGRAQFRVRLEIETI